LSCSGQADRRPTSRANSNRRPRGISNWVRQADRDEGRRSDGLTTDERTEFQRLKGENATLRKEREILKKPRLVRMGDRFDPARVFEFMKAHQAAHRVTTMCVSWTSPPADTMRGLLDTLVIGRFRGQPRRLILGLVVNELQ
jgi:transposase-like protein